MRSVLLVVLVLFLCCGYSSAEDFYYVKRVVDGDTIVLDNDETVRLIGVDTPELHHLKKPIMYYAEEAYKFTKQLCEGKKVKLEFDQSNSPKKHLDKYGRTLAYIYLEDGVFVNAEIVKQGYGFCYVKFPFKYMSEFMQYQKEAMEDERGLWAKLIYDPITSNIIMYYAKLNDEGKKMARDYLEYLTIKHRKGEEEVTKERR